MLSSSKSFSHSNGVNSTRADGEVDALRVSIFTFTQGCGFTLWGGQKEESITVGHANLHITA